MKTRQQDTPFEREKTALRRQMLAQRAALTPQFVAQAGYEVARRVEALPAFAAAKEVLCYLPVRNEVDAAILAQNILASGRRLLLPRCRPDAAGQLDFGCIHCLSEARPGRFGIPEPPEAVCFPPEAFTPDVIVLPGVAFDIHGTRLGFGGGYYDRLLALPMAGGAFTIGLAYAFQVVPKLPVAPWDKPVDALVTEQQTYRFTK